MDPSHMHLLWGCGQEQQGREDGIIAIAFQVKIGAPWDASTSSVFPKKKQWSTSYMDMCSSLLLFLLI